MLEKIIEWSVNNRLLVTIGIVAVIFAGFVSIQTTPVDAIPDLSDVQVIVLTEYPGQGPNVVEDQVIGIRGPLIAQDANEIRLPRRHGKVDPLVVA